MLIHRGTGLLVARGAGMVMIAALIVSLIGPQPARARDAAPTSDAIATGAAVGVAGIKDATDFSAARRRHRRYHNNAAAAAAFGTFLGIMGGVIAEQRRRDYYEDHYYYGGPGPYYYGPRYYRGW